MAEVPPEDHADAVDVFVFGGLGAAALIAWRPQLPLAFALVLATALFAVRRARGTPGNAGYYCFSILIAGAALIISAHEAPRSPARLGWSAEGDQLLMLRTVAGVGLELVDVRSSRRLGLDNRPPEANADGCFAAGRVAGIRYEPTFGERMGSACVWDRTTGERIANAWHYPRFSADGRWACRDQTMVAAVSTVDLDKPVQLILRPEPGLPNAVASLIAGDKLVCLQLANGLLLAHCGVWSLAEKRWTARHDMRSHGLRLASRTRGLFRAGDGRVYCLLQRRMAATIDEPERWRDPELVRLNADTGKFERVMDFDRYWTVMGASADALLVFETEPSDNAVSFRRVELSDGSDTEYRRSVGIDGSAASPDGRYWAWIDGQHAATLDVGSGKITRALLPWPVAWRNVGAAWTLLAALFGYAWWLMPRGPGYRRMTVQMIAAVIVLCVTMAAAREVLPHARIVLWSLAAVHALSLLLVRRAPWKVAAILLWVAPTVPLAHQLSQL